MSYKSLVYGFDISAPTTAPTLGYNKQSGFMSPGDYSYKVSFITQYGETTTGPASAVYTVTNKKSCLLTNFPTYEASAIIRYGLYRTSVGNTTPYRKVAELPDGITQYVDTLPDSDLGGVEPTESFGSSIGEERGYIVKSRPNVISVDTLAAGPNAQILREYTRVTGTGNVKLPPITVNLVGMELIITAVNGTVTIVPSNVLHTVEGSGSLSLNSGETISLICTSHTEWRDAGTSGGSSSAVTSFSGGTTGLTPSAPSTGNIVLGGTLSMTHGGTGNTNITAGSIVYSDGSTLQGAAGTTGQILISGGTGAPTWTTFTYNGSTLTNLPEPTQLNEAATLRTVLENCPIVLDTNPTGGPGDEKFPTDLTRGVWYGLNTKLNSFNSTCVTIGDSARTTATQSTAIGNNAWASATNAVAVGTGAICSATTGVAIGNLASAAGSGSSVAIGANASVSSNSSNSCVSIGQNATCTASSESVSIGRNAVCTSGGVAVALGNSTASGTSFAACDSTATGNSIAMGQCTATGQSFCAGWTDPGNPANVCSATNSCFVFGAGARANWHSIAIGLRANAVSVGNPGSVSIAMLENSNASADNAIAIGQNTRSNAVNAIAVGTSNTITGSNAVIFGNFCTNSATDGVIVGNSNVIGASGATQNVVIGTSSGSSVNRGVRNTAMGVTTFTQNITGTDCVAMGTNALQHNSTGRNIAIGPNALANLERTRLSITANQVNTTITASTAVFTPGMTGGTILWSGFIATLDTYVSPTEFQSVVNQTASGSAVIAYGTKVSTGTITQSGTTITGVGTAFNAIHIGGHIVNINGVFRILTVNSTTNVTVNASAAYTSTPLSLYYNNGSNNTAIGGNCASNLSSGGSNVIVGDGAAPSLENGSGNVIIGAGADAVNTNNTVVIGSGIVGTASSALYMQHRAGTGNAAQWNGNELVEQVSSIRYKTNVTALEDVGDKISRLRPVRYSPKEGFGDTSATYIGLIAEEVAEVYPEFVVYDKEGRPNGVVYDRIVALLIKDRHELDARISALENL